jgi:hypothetical protein
MSFSAVDILQEFVDAGNTVQVSTVRRNSLWSLGYRTFVNRFFGPMRDHYLSRNRIHQKRWRDTHKEQHRAQERARYWKIKAKRNAYGKAYVAAKRSTDLDAWRAKRREYDRRWRAKKKAAKLAV